METIHCNQNRIQILLIQLLTHIHQKQSDKRMWLPLHQDRSKEVRSFRHLSQSLKPFQEVVDLIRPQTFNLVPNFNGVHLPEQTIDDCFVMNVLRSSVVTRKEEEHRAYVRRRSREACELLTTNVVQIVAAKLCEPFEKHCVVRSLNVTCSEALSGSVE
jgi:hypothetical protein